MSLATASNGPEAKKFRFALPTQVVVNEFDFEKKRLKEEIDMENLSNGDGSENGLDLRSSEKVSPNNMSCKQEEISPSPSLSQDNSESTPFGTPSTPAFDFPFSMLFQQANAFMKSVSKEELKAAILAQSRGPAPSVPPTPPAPIPGALAVAASPAAQLFGEDDWSWHRNPAAAIRSGGTNKQTPVWKYFVYNKAENLSRCIIGDCTYMLKGPHTSTLACHLKKHPAEYAEFQKLKQEYTRERNAGQLNGSTRNSQPSSAESSARHTPTLSIPTNMKRSETLTNNNGIFGTTKVASSSGSKMQNKTSSMADILNLLNARANANVSPQQTKLEEPQMINQNKNIESPVNSVAPMLPFPAMMNQKTNPFFLNLLKHNATIMNNLNNNNQLAMNQNNGTKYQPFQQKTKNVENEKKWFCQDKKQKDMEIKLGLALATAQLPLNLINNPFFRDFVESAQPKFTMPLDASQIDDLINSQYLKTVQAIKMQLAATAKISLIIDVLKAGSKSVREGDENTEFPAKNLKSTPIVRFCVSAAYYSSITQAMEIVLLGIRQPVFERSIEESVKATVEQIMMEYDLNWDRVLRVVSAGLEEIGSIGKLLPRQLEPYNRKLTFSLINAFDTDPLVIHLKKAFYSMVYKFAENAEAVSILSKELGRNVSIPIGETFFTLAEYLLKIKNNFLNVCHSEEFDNLIPLLDDEQWIQLESVVNLLTLFKKHMKVIQDGQYATIDKVVPSLMQLKVCLERDYNVLGDLPAKLLNDIQKRAQYILDMSSECFDGSFIQATALNPQLAMLLDDSQINYAKNSIEKILTKRLKQVEETANRKSKGSCGVDAVLAAVVERKSSNVSYNPTSPTFSSASSTISDVSSSTTSALYPDLLQAANQRRKVLNDRPQNGKSLLAEAMIQSYFDDLVKIDSSTSNSIQSNSLGAITSIPPLQYWQLNMVKSPHLSDIALELLTVPSCAVSLERIFSYDGVSQNTYPSIEMQLFRTLDNPSRMERDTILRFNRNFIPKSI